MSTITNSESFTVSELDLTTWSQPTANLRWREGVLEQLMIVHAYKFGCHSTTKDWQPVPQAESQFAPEGN
jgi:hypothetical protein